MLAEEPFTEPFQKPKLSHQQHQRFYLPDQEWPEEPEAYEEFPEAEEFEDDGEEVQVDFTPRELLQYKLPTIDLFAPWQAEKSIQRENIVRQNIRILEETCKALTSRRQWSRRKSVPSVTKYEVKPAVGMRVNLYLRS